MKVILRERTWFSTQPLKLAELTTGHTDWKDYQTSPPGQTLLLTVNPISAFMRTDLADTKSLMTYAAPAAQTFSRFRQFKYVKTYVALVPAATSAQVDPAHVSTTATWQAMNPIDMQAQVHWRRWLGGSYELPFVRPTGSVTIGTTTKSTYDVHDAYNYDAAWMSAVKFAHCNVMDGFEFEARPKYIDVAVGSGMRESLLGYYTEANLGFRGNDVGSAEQGPGQAALRPDRKSVLTEGWNLNPFSGLIFAPKSDETDPEKYPGRDRWIVTGFNPDFPWFSDLFGAGVTAEAITLNTILTAIQKRFTFPLAFVRFPPAYGASFHWTMYMMHYLLFRDPVLLNGTWTAGRVQNYDIVNAAPEVPGSPWSYIIADDYYLQNSQSPDPEGIDQPLSVEMDTSTMWLPDEVSDSISFSEVPVTKSSTPEQPMPPAAQVENKVEKPPRRVIDRWTAPKGEDWL